MVSIRMRMKKKYKKCGGLFRASWSILVSPVPVAPALMT
jgi:hypothetical protein